jgi:hypothetical protein
VDYVTHMKKQILRNYLRIGVRLSLEMDLALFFVINIKSNNMAKKVTDHRKHAKKLATELESIKEVLDFKKSIDTSLLPDISKYTIAENKSLKEECTVMTQLTDIHLEEEVIKEAVNGLNFYNPEEARKRIDRYFKRLLYLTRQNRRAGRILNNLVLHLGGDGITGWIHDELKQTNSLTPIQACLMLQELYIKGISTLAEDGGFNNIKIVCSCGNHSRATEKNQSKNSIFTSYEYWIYRNLEQFLKLKGYSNIEIILPAGEFTYLTVLDKVNVFSHGIGIKYQGGIGGIEVPLKRMVTQENNIIPFDMMWLAHMHTYLVLTKIRMGGSVIGYSEFSRIHRFPPEVPKMQFQLLDKKRGYTLNEPIILLDF